MSPQSPRAPQSPNLVGVLRGIVEEIDQDLIEAQTIDLDRRGNIRHPHPQFVAALLDYRPYGLAGVFDDLTQIDRRLVEFDAAAGETGEVQEVVDQMGECES
ncbi:MAG: hypothetical protein M3329_05835 [Pseudomonadota bacterium]|nr:hypothetical protein [Pseudomonadota bacterium]